MGFPPDYINDQTPLDDSEKEGLKISTISSRGELNEFEQFNIQAAIKWSLRRRIPQNRILSLDFVKELHFRMFFQVWSWAGEFRNSNKNLGVDKFQIGTQLKILMDDCRYWIENQTFDPDELVIRTKHRMVSIHPFPNGNGRHSRIYADVLITHVFGLELYTWGGGDLVKKGENRKCYLEALVKADAGDFKPLIAFARKRSV